MKSISFRPTSLFLCLIMLLVLAAVPARAADPTPADLVPMDPAQQAISHVSSSPVPTEAQAYAAMNAFRPRYPEGMRYTNDDFYEWNGGIYYGGYGCAGFAFMLSDAAFGDLPARTVYPVDMSKVHVGDILRVNNDSHSVIIMERYSNYVVLAEANYNSSVHWGRIMTAAEVAASTYMMTRYPQGTFGEVNVIRYDANGGSGAPDQDVFDLGTPGVISTQIPYRPYYIFKGWSTSAAAATASYQPGQSITLTGSVTLYAVWAADPNAIIGNTFPKTYTATINSPYQEYSFRFTPSVTAFYCFESSCEGSMDPVAYLADASGNELARNDDGGENANFKLPLLLTAGKTYTLTVGFFGDATGKIPVLVTRNILQTLAEPTSPASYNVVISEPENPPRYLFTPQLTTNYIFESVGSGDTIIIIYDEAMQRVAYNDDGGEGSNFLLNVQLEEDTPYVVEARYYYSSNTGSFTMKFSREDPEPAVITKHPASVTTYIGDTALFHVDATGSRLRYQWQYQMPGSTTWTNTTLTGAKTDTLSVPATTARSGCKYRCLVADYTEQVLATRAASLTCNDYIVITGHPLSKAVDAGTNANFGVIAKGKGLTYQWQYQMPGSTAWTNTTLTGCKTSMLTIPVTTARNGCKYRCVVKDSAGHTTYTNPAALYIKANLAITGHPGTKTVYQNTTANFGVIATGTGITYQWQYQMPGSTAWTNTTLTGCRTSLLSVPATPARNGCKYRCVVTDYFGATAVTNPATLTVKGPVKVTGSPLSKTVAAGTNAQFGVIADGAGLTYQWQYKMGSGAWTNTTLTGCRTSLLTVPATAARNGCQYRCVVTDAGGNVAYTNPATLTVR